MLEGMAAYDGRDTIVDLMRAGAEHLDGEFLRTDLQRDGHRSRGEMQEIVKDIRGFYRLERKLMLEERICMPVAGMVGAVGGVVNEFLRV